MQRAVKQPTAMDRQAPGLTEEYMRAAVSRLLSAEESAQARPVSRAQEE